MNAVQAAVDAHFEKELDYKSHDCIRLVSTSLKVLGHPNVLKGLAYSSATGAIRALKKSGFTNLIEAVDSRGFERIAPAQALSGDILAYESDHFGGWCLGLSMGDGQALAFANTLCMQGPVALASFAWRVPVLTAVA